MERIKEVQRLITQEQGYLDRCGYVKSSALTKLLKEEAVLIGFNRNAFQKGTYR
jgi:hypothetical protein